MRYDLDMLQDDIQNLGEVTTGWREYTPRIPGADYLGDDSAPNVDPNSPEAAAYDYFLDKYGFVGGPDIAARFFAIHSFVIRNLHKLERRGLLKQTRNGPPMAEDLLRFLLTCFEEPAPDGQLPRSIYDLNGGLGLPFEPIMADFHRLRVLRRRLAPLGLISKIVFMGIDEVLGDKRQTVLRLADQYGAYNVRKVFGSVARGEARSDSDIDFLVDVRPAVGMDFLRLWDALEDLLGREVDLVTERALDADLRPTILHEAVRL